MTERQLDEKAVFDVARRIEAPEARRLYLAHSCGGDAALRARVEALLRVYDEESSFLQSPAEGQRATVADRPAAEAPGTVIGPYKLVQQIGEGGMGAVFLAEQIHPVQRRVAVKVIKPGMDSRQVLARFEAERQALALMDHPNIARVLDAGATERGRPYFVMELVKGVPITAYCDEHRLTPRERLELFVPVCQAVQHAHQKGIIHRDLKPSNVLLALYDSKPVPKVIDFGVAKAAGPKLTERTLCTEFGAVVGTLEYMSPEQAQLNQLDIDTRSDIYSLGVLLYELLTGSTPLRPKRLKQAAILEALRLIREEEPQRPSTRLSTTAELPNIAANRGLEPKKLSGLVRGELDWIVMKCLEKDRNRRYETASGLARDIERYLHDEPVQACPPSAGYRFRKFVRRNRAALAVTALITATLVLAVVALAVSNVWITRERDQKGQALHAKDVALQNESAALAEAKKQEGIAKNQQGIAEGEAKRAREQEKTARRHLYAAHTNLADHAREMGHAGRVLELLEAMRLAPEGEDLRSFEWYCLWRLCHQGHRLTLRGHGGPVGAVAYSPDGKTLATASDDGSVRLWDPTTGQVRGVLRGHEAAVTAVAFAADGKTLATASSDRTAKLWDLATGQQRGTFTGHLQSVNSVALSPDGTRFATGGGDGGKPGELKLWDVATRQERATLNGHWSSVSCVAFSPDGTVLASASWDGDAKLWDVAGGKERFTLHHLGAQGVRCVTFSPDGKTLASAGEGDMVVKLWDVATGQERFRFQGHTGPVSGVAFAPDGKTLASGGEDHTVRLWDAATGQRRALAHVDDVRSVAFAPDGKTLATASRDRTVKLWDVDVGQEPVTLTGTTSWALSSDGKTLASSQGETVKLLNVATGRERSAFPAPAAVQLAFAHDTETLLACSRDGTVRVWDVAGGRQRATFPGRRYDLLAFAPDGKHLARANYSCTHTIAVDDCDTGKGSISLEDPEAVFLCMTFAPDGKTLAVGTIWPAAVKLWDTATGRVVATLKDHSERVSAVAFAPDGKALAAGCHDGTIHVWDSAAGQKRARFKGHTGRVMALAFCPDGKTLASGSYDRTVKLWDLATGEERLTLKGHTGCVQSAVFTSDGKTLATGDAEGTVKLWRAATDQEVMAESSAPDPREELARRHADRGRQLRAGTRPEDAEEAFRQALDLYAGLAAASPAEPEYSEQLASVHLELGDLLRATGRPAEAEKAYRQAIAIGEKLVADYPTVLPYRWQLTSYYSQLGELLWYANRIQELEPPARRAVAVLEELPAGSSPNSFFLATKGHALRNLAYRLWRLRKLDEAEKAFREAAAVFEKLTAEVPGEPGYLDFLADTQLQLGSLLRDRRPEAAKEEWARAVADFARVADRDPRQASAREGLGTVHAELGQWDQAVADFSRASELKPDDPVVHYRLALARLGAGDLPGYRGACAGLLERFGRTDKPEVAQWAAWPSVLAPDALTDLDRPVRLAESALASDPKNGWYCTTLGAALYRAGRFGEAVRRLDEASAAWEQAAAKPVVYSPAYTWFFLAMAHQRLGHAGEARQWLGKAIQWVEQGTQNAGDEGSRSWNRRLTLEILRHEAEALVNGRVN